MSTPDTPRIRNRVTELLGVEIPIVQAPMGWIARAQLASAVSNAGGMGIIETSSGELDAVREEILKMRDLTDRPFGVNIAQLFVRDPKIVDFVIGQGVRFVTTSAGNPMQYTKQLKDAGLTVFHVIPTLRTALKAIGAGVDGLIVEGGEGGGFKNPRDVATMVLLPLVCEHVQVPVIAAGGIVDGRSMAAAFALGAEGVQMGTRMVSSAESPVHQNFKQAIVDAAETDTVFLNRHHRPGLRALRTERSERLEREEQVDLGELGTVLKLYFGGDMEASIALSGQVVGRIDAVKPVREVLHETLREFFEVAGRLGKLANSDR
ncbi:MAG: nitronate monooxygenase [Myxococcales bacterium]|nr:nitronate monooxygenase [Myxococcales bacterium]